MLVLSFNYILNMFINKRHQIMFLNYFCKLGSWFEKVLRWTYINKSIKYFKLNLGKLDFQNYEVVNKISV